MSSRLMSRRMLQTPRLLRSIAPICPTRTPRSFTSPPSRRPCPQLEKLAETCSVGPVMLPVRNSPVSATPPARRPRAISPTITCRSLVIFFASVLLTLSVQPAIRTVSDTPHMNDDIMRLRMLTATIEARMALPTATPTPAGPPVALNP